MRPILIDSAFEKGVESFCADPFKFGGRCATFIRPVARLETFSKSKKLTAKQKRYVKAIITKYSQILKAKPEEMQTLIKSFDKIISKAELDKDVKIGRKTRKFHEWIVEYMRL
jgi:hypothetical protein